MKHAVSSALLLNKPLNKIKIQNIDEKIVLTLNICLFVAKSKICYGSISVWGEINCELRKYK